MRYTSSIILALYLLIMIGCESAFYSKSYTFSNDIWNYNDPKDFEFEVKDTVHIHNMVLTIDHTDIYPYQNLYLNVLTTFPSDTTIYQPLSLELANAAGFWLGECSGSQCRLSIPIQSNVHFPEIGKYRVALEQYTRTDTLKGIQKLKLEVLEVGNK